MQQEDRYKATFEAYDKVASAYQDKFMDMDLYNDTYDLFCALIQKQNATVFEIGCGPGNITKYMLNKRPDFKVFGIDAAPKMIELAKANNPTADFEVMDCRTIDKVNSTFDGIVCGFCMPYLSKDDCCKLIKDCSKLLVGGGTLYFSAIEGDYEQSGYQSDSSGKIRMFIYYHEADHLLNQLAINDFELVQLARKSYPMPGGTSSIHSIFIARKGSGTKIPLQPT